MTERITITFTKDGSFRGASAQDFEGNLIPLDAEALVNFAPGVQLAAQLSEAQAMLVTMQTMKDDFVARVQTALETGDVSQFVAIATDLVTPEQEKQKQADLALADELKAQAAALEAKYTTQSL